MNYYVVYPLIPASEGGVGELNLLAEDEQDAMAQALEVGYPPGKVLHCAYIGEEHYLEIYSQWFQGNLKNASLGTRLVIRQVVTLRRVANAFAQQAYIGLMEGKLTVHDLPM